MIRFTVICFVAATLFAAAPASAETTPNIEDFGGGVNVADNAPAFNAALAAGNSVRFRDCYTAGQYHFRSEPNRIKKMFAIYGCLPNVDGFTWVYRDFNRDYTPSSRTRWLFHWTTGQPYVNDVFILAGSGSGGAAISIVPAVGGFGGPGGLNHVRISATGGTWNYSVYVDGSAIVPGGVRTLYFNNVTLFGASIRAAYLKSVVHFNWSVGAISQAGGTNGGLEITGTAAAPSSEIAISIDYVTDNVVSRLCQEHDDKYRRARVQRHQHSEHVGHNGLRGDPRGCPTEELVELLVEKRANGFQFPELRA